MLPRAALLLCLATLLPAQWGCQAWDRDWRFSGATMGTRWHVQLRPEPGLAPRTQVRRRIEQELRQVDRTLSGWREDSELSRFNRAPVGAWVPVSTATARVVLLARELAAFTEGNFDPTVAPLVNLWGFGPQQTDAPPPQTQQQARMAQVGYWRFLVRRHPPALRKNTAVQLDLSAIAKGDAVDRIARALRDLGVRHYLVEIGGELRVLGTSPRGTPWRIGIEHPQAPDGLQRALLLPPDTSLASSGDYYNYRNWEGRRHPPLINPYTGAPLQQQLSGVTVAADSTARADALATALMVMGTERGLEFAEQHQIAAFFIVRSAKGLLTSHSTAFAPLLADP